MRLHTYMSSVMILINLMTTSFAFMESPDECSNRFEFRHDMQKIFPYLRNCTVVRQMIPVCAKKIVVSYSEHPPYVLRNKTSGTVVGYLPGMLRLALETCCFGCAKVSFVGPHTLFKKYFNENSNIIMPVESAMTSKKYTGFDYIHFMEVNGVTILGMAMEGIRGKISRSMFQSILSTWPLFVIAISMAIIAGCIVWLLDTRFNRQEFPLSFPRGPFEGFWWAFVTMTTVGYGDRSPKSTVARLFAVIWILAGITIFSMYTATLTSALTTNMQQGQNAHLYGKKIGVLRSTAAGISASSQKKADLQHFDTVTEMVQSLKAEQTFGFALDDRIANHYKSYIEQQIPTIQQLQHIPIQYNSYGVLSYDTNLTKFLRSFFESNEDNRIVMASNIEKEHWLSEDQFFDSPSGMTQIWLSDNPVFYTTLWIMLGMGVVAIIVGMTLKCLYQNENRILLRHLNFQTMKDSSEQAKECLTMEVNDNRSQNVQQEFQRDVEELTLKWLKKFQCEESANIILLGDKHKSS